MAPFIIKLVYGNVKLSSTPITGRPTLFYFEVSPVITFPFLAAVMLSDEHQLGGGWQVNAFFWQFQTVAILNKKNAFS